MFSADLSWTDPGTERVGERRERLAREQEKERSISSASGGASIKSSISSKSSIQDDKELWWTSSLKKAKSIKPSKKVTLRPGTNRSIGGTTRLSSALPPALDLDAVRDARNSGLNPTYTFSLSPTLPSGAPLDPPEYEVPELEGDFSSRCTNSSGSRSSHERQLKFPGKIKIIDELREHQQLSPSSYVARTIKTSSEAAEQVANPQSPTTRAKMKRPFSVKIEGCLGQTKATLHGQREDSATPKTGKHPSYASGLQDGQLVAWRPPSDWDILLPNPLDPDQEKGLPPLPLEDVSDGAHGAVELTRFQRFIRRMESAGPKVILDRLKEEWHNPLDEEAGDEMLLEKQLWVLTAFQLQNLGRYSRFPRADTGKILELFGNLSEVYQLSAMHPRQKVHYLTTKHEQSVALPNNVDYLAVPEAAALPLPYDDATFSHIRASTLPSLVPSAKLPLIFQECYRVLAPGGMLEIRIMDAAPLRRTAGPKMKAWIEDRLSLSLERLFRCSKPCTLVPSWVTDAGFDLPIVHPSDGEQNMQLPCAYDDKSGDVDAELSCLVGHAIWKDIWGDFIEEIPGEPRWWWEDEEVMQECLELNTVFDCGAIFAFKN